MLQANGGSVDRYAELVGEALATMESDASLGSKVLLNIGLCQAYGWAGMFDKALHASDAALAGIDAVDKFEEDFIGYSLKQWSLVLRGRVLARLGRLDEAARCFAEVTVLPPHSVDPVLLEIAHYGMAEVACAAEDIDQAERHANTVWRIAERHDNAYVGCFAFACTALVDEARRRFPAAITGFRKALEMVRRHNVAKEFETELLARLAECCYAIGDLDAAGGYCDEAITLSQERCNRHQHVRALVIASALVRASGRDGAPLEAEELLQRARGLVRASEASAVAFRVKALPEVVLG
jgi:tetratricopeptide (TPR) repeat protein